ncbi:hypothetical protein E2C01_094201 [Portunus trituberculatus]|uniref:Uncharacterized protein n=1 Tax=Portunus trituberculatus TaxID=210409 RepID=A0A5B7K0Z2_PORTR|nr:hypothetical protein [Portunus trituberculatus]
MGGWLVGCCLLANILQRFVFYRGLFSKATLMVIHIFLARLVFVDGAEIL